MKTTIDNVLVSHDYGHEVYDVTMTARDIHQMYKHGLLVIDPERQRGRNSVTGSEIVKTEKVERWTQQLLDDKAVFGQLSWNFRPEETKAYYDKQNNEFVIEYGSATLPDSAHRHRSIFRAVESIARGSSFDLDRKFSVRIWCVAAGVENDLFYGMNQEGDKADATRSKWLSQKNIGQKLAASVVRSSPHLTEANIETVSNTLSVKNPRLAAFNTFAVAFEQAWGDIDDDDLAKVATWFVGFWDKLTSVRPELKKVSLPERQEARRTSLASSAIAIHGFVQLGRRFYSEDLDLSLLEALTDDEYFSFSNPEWKAIGVLVPSVNKKGDTVLNFRNATQTRVAMGDALMRRAGLKPVDKTSPRTPDTSQNGSYVNGQDAVETGSEVAVVAP